MARTRPGSMASASLASHGPLRPTRRPGASQAASTWPRSLSPFSPAHRASPKGLPGLWANEACAKALSPRGGAALMLPPTTKRGPPAPLKLAPPTPPPFPRTQTRNRTHCRPLAGSTGSAEPAALPGLPGANLFGGIYNVDQLKLSPSSPSSSNFANSVTLPARRFSFVFDTTQNLFFLSAFKCCVSVSSCPGPRLELLTHRECHAAPPLRPQVWPGRAPTRAPTSNNKTTSARHQSL